MAIDLNKLDKEITELLENTTQQEFEQWLKSKNYPPTTTVGGSGKERCPYELFVIKYFGLPEDVSFDKVPKVTYADIVSILALYSEQEHSLSIKEFAEKEANKHFNKEISSYAWEACVSSCVAGAAHAQQLPFTVDIVEALEKINPYKKGDSELSYDKSLAYQLCVHKLREVISLREK